MSKPYPQSEFGATLPGFCDHCLNTGRVETMNSEGDPGPRTTPCPVCSAAPAHEQHTSPEPRLLPVLRRLEVGSIFSVVPKRGRTFEFREECDSYHATILTAAEVLALADELRALANSPEVAL